MTKVYAKDASIQKHIKHPNGKSFRDDGSAEWPNDQFTKRRIKDGDVTMEAPDPPPEEGRAGKPKPPAQAAQPPQPGPPEPR